MNTDEALGDAYRRGYLDAINEIHAELDARLELYALDISDVYTLLEDAADKVAPSK